jgi:SAM-dependent methyltransferase
MSEIVPTAARFLGRVEDYVRYRPSYPPASIDMLLDGLGDPGLLTIADVGAGTGISSRLLAARGARVIAIEPNPEMRAAAAAPRVEVRDATAEHTGLATASVDVVTAFQAFHWFATPTATAEFGRVLRPGGRVALVWNVRNDDDAFTKAYGEIADLNSDAAARAGQRSEDPDLASLLGAGGLENLRATEFESAQRLDLQSLLGRARSASYVPREGPEYEAIVRALSALYERFVDAGGTVTLVYRTHVHLADTPR